MFKYSRIHKILNHQILYQTGKMNKVFFLINFHPKGQAGGFHLPRYSGFAIKDYDCTLKCLAYESLRLVQDSGYS